MHLLLLLACVGPKADLALPVDTACASPVAGFVDADGDGFGDPSSPIEACEGTPGFVADGSDCDDSAVAVFPGAAEIWYDGADEDCGGDSDFDQDGDGYDRDDECDDTDPTRFPDASVAEIWYDGVDQNCDGNDGDQDGDGWYVAGYPFEVPGGYGAGDCQDDPTYVGDALNGFPAPTAADIHPDAPDTAYDGLDEDCAGGDDFDVDGDGSRTNAWPDDAGVYGDDCVDVDPEVHPGAADAWYDGVDSDCDGRDDYDQDGDGFDAAGGTGEVDCDDASGDVYPGGREACGDDVDADCDGTVDDPGAKGCLDYYADVDGDGYGGGAAACLCAPEGAYTTEEGADCDDADPARWPGAPELCDGMDNGCVSGWSTGDEAGIVSEVAADGSWRDVTASFSAGRAGAPAAWSLSDGATLEVCPGLWFVHLDLRSSVTFAAVDGPYGASVTVLDGGGSGRVLDGGGGGTLGISGVTIEGGEADYGGGVALDSVDVTISDVLFTSNSASVEGGGLYLASSTASIQRTTFLQNGALASGGGMSAESTTLELVDSTFDGNSSGPDDYASGGGLTFIAYAGEPLTVAGCVFSENSATADTATAFAGALYASVNGTGETTVTDTSFSSNVAVSLGTGSGSAQGGAVYLSLAGSGGVLFDGVDLSGNLAVGQDWAYGGAAVVWQNAANDVSWVDTTLYGNAVSAALAIGGGALFVGSSGSVTTIRTSVVDGNGVYDASGGVSGYGGGLYHSMLGGSATLSSTTVRGNLSSGGGVEAYLGSGAGLTLTEGSVVDGNTGDGLLFTAVDALSTVDVVDSRITGNTGSGVSMLSGSSAGSATLTCTGSSAEDAGMYGNGGEGVTGDCSAGGLCTFLGTACDLVDPSTRIGNGGASIHLYDKDWNYLADATFWCDGTDCS